jgi:hypothetical protein
VTWATHQASPDSRLIDVKSQQETPTSDEAEATTVRDPETTPARTEERLNRLEEENRSLKRRWRLMQGGLASLIVILLTLGAVGCPAQGPDGSFRQLTVESLVVRDYLAVRDAAGKNRVTILTLPNGTVVQGFLDQAGKTRVLLSTTSEGQAFQEFDDKDGKKRVTIGTHPDGLGGLTLYDQDGNTRIGMCTLVPGWASQVFFDKHGKERVAIQTSPDGEASQQFGNADGRVQLRLPR